MMATTRTSLHKAVPAIAALGLSKVARLPRGLEIYTGFLKTNFLFLLFRASVEILTSKFSLSSCAAFSFFSTENINTTSVD